MGAVKEYDPDQVQILFNLVPLSGFAEDKMADIEEDGKLFELVQGVDGQTTRSKNLKRSALLTIHLLASSQLNAALSLIVAQDLLTAGGAGVGPVLIRDGNGTSLFTSAAAWIEERPKKSYGTKSEANEWKLRVVDYVFFEGGST